MAGKTFEKAGGELRKTIDDVLQKYHSRLLRPIIEQDVTIEAIVVYGPRNSEGVQTGPAIQVGGRNAYACIRASRLEERVAGRGDAIMWIDGDDYKKWPDKSLVAIIDHELTHVALAIDPKTEKIVLDDCGRVKIKMREHDFQVGWFDEVARRHGQHSIEVMQASTLAASGQMYFPGFELRELVRKRRA